ncbi:C4-dicarboxylic acid transporter DauA [Poseidonibacter sp.]|uniref:C4-dicarboxylic acid transporter DauA n=1 Tax=Poseidonibacter sp. TaxID=2321188 RepID=UPI003C7376C2
MKSNIFSGIVVAIISLPLSMALAIAINVPPENGIYTAIIAGIMTALFGSSKVNISGPTAAFVVILIPIVQEFGLQGLLICGILAGIIQVFMGIFRLGTLIELVPYPITVGFTSGIAVVIASFQLKDFLGLKIENFSGSFIEKVTMIYNSIGSFKIEEFLVGISTIAIVIYWQRLNTKIPATLVSLLLITTFVYLSNYSEFTDISTIKSTFSFNIQGIAGEGIPPVPLQFINPWNNFDFSLDLFYKLIPHAIAIAILGALESLLCAVISDGMIKKRTNPNKELIGQGLTNLVIPFFAGIPATAAIARTVVNIKSGATNQISSIVNSIFIFIAVLLIAPLLSFLPMASLSGLLLIVAWNMSEFKHFINIIKIAPKHDVYILLTCFILTILIDMQIAIAVGMILASLLFIKRTIDLYTIKLITENHDDYCDLPSDVCIYDINGPMFFGAAQNALKTILTTENKYKTIIINMENVHLLDMTAMVALKSILDTFKENNTTLIISGLENRMKNKLYKIGFHEEKNILEFHMTIKDSLSHINYTKKNT